MLILINCIWNLGTTYVCSAHMHACVRVYSARMCVRMYVCACVCICMGVCAYVLVCVHACVQQTWIQYKIVGHMPA